MGSIWKLLGCLTLWEANWQQCAQQLFESCACPKFFISVSAISQVPSLHSMCISLKKKRQLKGLPNVHGLAFPGDFFRRADPKQVPRSKVGAIEKEIRDQRKPVEGKVVFQSTIIYRGFIHHPRWLVFDFGDFERTIQVVWFTRRTMMWYVRELFPMQQ